MIDKEFAIMEQYECKVRQYSRGRGAFILDTDRGCVLLREYTKNGKRLETLAKLLDYLYEKGMNVDVLIKNKEGSYLSTDSEGNNFIVTRWSNGRECDIKNLQDICQALRTLALLHKNLEKYDCGNDDFQIARSLSKEYDKHNRELKMIKNYLATKRNKNDFELLAYSNCDYYLEEGIKAMDILAGSGYEEELKRCAADRLLCHGNFNYHNIYFFQNQCELCGFEQSYINLRLWDLYNFMRKLMEKCDWDIKMGYLMFHEYDKVYPLSAQAVKILGAMFAYPEKYWKLLNFYYNSNKAWIPAKSLEKLKKVLLQNTMRNAFVKTIC